MPISFDHETDVVEVLFGKGDVCVGVGAICDPDPNMATLSLSDLKQECCISTSLLGRVADEDLEGEQVIISVPKTPEGMNAARVFLLGVVGLIIRVRLHLLKKEISIDTPPGLQVCIFCNHKETDEEEGSKLTDYYGAFICKLCATQIYVASTDPNELSLQERYDISKRITQLQESPREERGEVGERGE